MPRFAANLSWLFTELPFRDRFAAAADAGFRAVEFLFPYDHPADAVAGWARAAGVEVVLFNMPAGDWAAGERGLAALPGREAEFAASIEVALHYAEAFGCIRMHCMAGNSAGDTAHTVMLSNLDKAARKFAETGHKVAVEPLNSADNPGFFLNTLEQARSILAEVSAPNLQIQADLYHLQIMGGNLTNRLKAAISDIGHVQVAGVPARREPDSGELDCHNLFELLDDLGYPGWIGAEYRPAVGTLAGLGWLQRYI